MRAPACRRPLRRPLVVLLSLLVVASGALPAEAAPAERAGTVAAARADRVSRDVRRSPELGVDVGWSGFAFDACRAPSLRAMDRWRTSSPFLGVGIYIGGTLRACGQPHLTHRWVSRQVRSGWKVLPIWVGPQASCTRFGRRISSARGARGLYPTARLQGQRAARGARAAAAALGIPRGSTLWYDLEAFSTRNGRCRASSLSFLTGWTRELHRQGYSSGVYSSISGAIRALRYAPTGGPRGYAAPDHVWFAWANRRADAWMGTHWVRAPRWQQHRRVHQYALNVSATYGGVRLRIDRNFVDLGVPGAAARGVGPCGPGADLRTFRQLHWGDTGPLVSIAQCLLRYAGHPRRTTAGSFGADTREVLRAFQRARRLRPTGKTDAPTWVALMAAGSRPVVKRGSAGPAVRRVQRALNAALPGSLPVTGLFGGGTAAAVRRYQARVRLLATGVVGPRTWSALAHGLLHRPHGPRRAAHGAAGRHHATGHRRAAHHRAAHHRAAHHRAAHHRVAHHAKPHRSRAAHRKHHRR